jgi:hypothetical protein
MAPFAGDPDLTRPKSNPRSVNVKSLLCPSRRPLGNNSEAMPTGSSVSYELLQHGTLKSYPGLPHGMPTTHAAQINADLFTFVLEGVRVSVGV